MPVSVIFGANDNYLNAAVAGHLASQFAHADLQLIADAGHWPQWDQPQAIAEAIATSLRS